MAKTTFYRLPTQKIMRDLIAVYRRGDGAGSLRCGRCAALQYPASFAIWNIIGLASLKIGASNLATQAFRRALNLNSQHPTAPFYLGLCLLGQKNEEQALALFEQVVFLKPDHPKLFFYIGVSLKNAGTLDLAIIAFQKELIFFPEAAGCYEKMAAILIEKGSTHLVGLFLRKAQIKKPASLEILDVSSHYFKRVGRVQKFVQFEKKKLLVAPNSPEPYHHIATFFKDNGILEKCIRNFRCVTLLRTESAAAFSNLAGSLYLNGVLNRASLAAKKSMLLAPNFFPAYNNLGNNVFNDGAPNTGITLYGRALKLKPFAAEVYAHIAYCLKIEGRLGEAVVAFQRACALKPGLVEARAQVIFQRRQLCDWSRLSHDRMLARSIGVVTDSVTPFSFLAVLDEPATHLRRARKFAAATAIKNQRPFPARSRKKPRRLRIGYFSSDFGEHVVARQMARVLELHNRENFEIYGYSLAQREGGPVGQRLREAMENFKDLARTGDREVAEIARADQIDVAIDLTGPMDKGRPQILSLRAAPLQINYLGYPGSMGAEYIDYIIGDAFLIPRGFEKYYSERIIFMPHTYQAQDDQLFFGTGVPSRSTLGLPEDAFVFCAINGAYKITPEVFDIWMQLLVAVENSVLWLFCQYEEARRNLIQETIYRGVNPDRVIFAAKVDHAKYLARFKAADLYLDTFNYNAGATASHALWAGLPLLTKAGAGYTARMAGSLLTAAGLPELITHSTTEYKNLALKLATDHISLNYVRDKLRQNRSSAPLFDAPLFVANLERAIDTVHNLYLSGERPKHIYI